MKISMYKNHTIDTFSNLIHSIDNDTDEPRTFPVSIANIRCNSVSTLARIWSPIRIKIHNTKCANKKISCYNNIYSRFTNDIRISFWR